MVYIIIQVISISIPAFMIPPWVVPVQQRQVVAPGNTGINKLNGHVFNVTKLCPEPADIHFGEFIPGKLCDCLITTASASLEV